METVNISPNNNYKNPITETQVYSENTQAGKIWLCGIK